MRFSCCENLAKSALSKIGPACLDHMSWLKFFSFLTRFFCSSSLSSSIIRLATSAVSNSMALWTLRYCSIELYTSKKLRWKLDSGLSLKKKTVTLFEVLEDGGLLKLSFTKEGSDCKLSCLWTLLLITSLLPLRYAFTFVSGDNGSPA